MTESTSNSYQRERISHWDNVAIREKKWFHFGKYYHKRLIQIYQFHVSRGLKVLEIGCGKGDLLGALSPSYGVGIDFSPVSISRAKEKYPNLKFLCLDSHDLSSIDQQFDVIILSDLVNDLWDVQVVFQQLVGLTNNRTRVILNFYSRLWEFPLTLAERLGLANPNLNQNWLTTEDVLNLLELSGFEQINAWSEILWPIYTPIISPLMNRILVRFWPIYHLSLTNFVIARPNPTWIKEEEASVSVVVAARNEAGNIPSLFQRLPKIGSDSEIVFVEGHSVDETYEVIVKEAKNNPEWSCQIHKQVGVGKGDAIRMGFDKAKNDILMILDADLTVPPEDLPRFYEAMLSGRGEFINGVRLVYPMESEAMRFLNTLGNKLFSLAFSWIFGQGIKDTLCGTKVLWKKDYQLIRDNRAYFGDFDPFGDFDLLFGASKLGLKIIDLPIRYRQRTYGETNIDRWRHGLLLMRMVVKAARVLKFI